MRLSRELRDERENGLAALEKHPVVSVVASAVAVSSPLGLGRELVRLLEDHLLGKDLDLAMEIDGDRQMDSGLAEAARLSLTCFSTPTSSSSTR